MNKDDGLTLDKAETAGLVTDAEWKTYNRDHDGTLELDEWLNIVRARFVAADPKRMASSPHKNSTVRLASRF